MVAGYTFQSPLLLSHSTAASLCLNPGTDTYSLSVQPLFVEKVLYNFELLNPLEDASI
jgi:hypothetical protein